MHGHDRQLLGEHKTEGGAGGGTYHWAVKGQELYVSHLVTFDPTCGGRTGIAPLILSLVNRSRLVIEHLHPSEALHMEKNSPVAIEYEAT